MTASGYSSANSSKGRIGKENCKLPYRNKHILIGSAYQSKRVRIF